MDNDISHSVQAELDAINARLDALEGGQANNELPETDDKPGQGPKPDEPLYDPSAETPAVEETTTTSRSSRSRS